MKLPESYFSRILLAYLPFMVCPFDLTRMAAEAAWAVLFLWITVFFFWFTRRLFPERLLRPAFFLWLLAWAQAAWTLAKLPPFWIVSVFFLMPVSFLEAQNKAARVRVFSRLVPRYFWDRFLSGAGFLCFVLAMDLGRVFFCGALGAAVFAQPAGIFLLLTIAAVAWKNQPFKAL
ncbi:MAG TPA: hypothetical protein PLL75_02370 [Candidatus Omnitrophota bacterium]|nr:hypothetical protein [Candidatus Omnitrophota bacterium]HPS36557.1 hypothetical protein [Candidatus Omnitrophota bacterium]